MQNSAVLKALADDTRRQIVILLLRHNYCVGALARELNLSKGAVSQHLKVLKEVGLVTGKRKGRLMHYEVSQDALKGLAAEIEKLASIQRQPCIPPAGGCQPDGEDESTEDGRAAGCGVMMECGFIDSKISGRAKEL